jgi:hypothetical protein
MIEGMGIILKTREGSEESESICILAKRCFMASDKPAFQPSGKAVGCGETARAAGEKRLQRLSGERQKRHPLFKSPGGHLPRENSQLTSRQPIRELGPGSRRPAEEFVAANARQKNTISVRGETRSELSYAFGFASPAAGQWGNPVRVKGTGEVWPLANIDMAPGSASPLFDLREIGTLVPVWFEIVVVGNRIEPGSIGLSPCKNRVGHANNRGRVHAAA